MKCRFGRRWQSSTHGIDAVRFRRSFPGPEEAGSGHLRNHLPVSGIFVRFPLCGRTVDVISILWMSSPAARAWTTCNASFIMASSPLEKLSAETEWMAGGALAAVPEDVPAVVLPCGLDWLPAGSCQGFDAGPSGTVLVRGRSQHYLIVLASVSANRNLTHHDEIGHNERAARSPGGAPTSQHFHGRGCSNEHAQHERFGTSLLVLWAVSS